MQPSELSTGDLLRAIKEQEELRSLSVDTDGELKALRQELVRRRCEVKYDKSTLARNDDREPVTREWIDDLPRTDVHGWRIGDNPNHTFDMRFGTVFRNGMFEADGKCWLWIWVDSDQSAVQTWVVIQFEMASEKNRNFSGFYPS